MKKFPFFVNWADIIALDFAASIALRPPPEALTAAIAAGSVASGEVAVTNGFSIIEASPLQITVATGALTAGAITAYVAYINGPDA